MIKRKIIFLASIIFIINLVFAQIIGFIDIIPKDEIINININDTIKNKLSNTVTNITSDKCYPAGNMIFCNIEIFYNGKKTNLGFRPAVYDINKQICKTYNKDNKCILFYTVEERINKGIENMVELTLNSMAKEKENLNIGIKNIQIK